MAYLDLAVREAAPADLRLAANEGPDRLADIAVVLVVFWWGAKLVIGTGGREPHLLSVGLVLLLVATLRVRPWRVLPALAYGSLVALSAAGFVVCALAPTGWAGANEAASWTFAAQLAALLLAWARDRARRLALVAALVVSSALSFASGWLAWWGGENPQHPFVGTFYWHNQEGVFLAAGAVAAAGLLLTGDRSTRLLAWVAAPLCAAGTVFTTSRGSMAALALGFGVLAVFAVMGARARRDLLRLVLVAALALGLAFLLSGPPFFASRANPLAGTEARSAAGETLSANTGHRLDDWGWAVRVFEHRPLAGSGFHGLAGASAQLDPQGRGSLTPFAHNGYLQVLSDGGLALALPFLVVLLLLLWRVRGALSWREGPTAAAVAGLLVLLFHSGMDFDWSYPALLAAPALLVAALPGISQEPQSSRGRLLLGCGAVALVALAAVPAWHGSLSLSVAVGGSR